MKTTTRNTFIVLGLMLTLAAIATAFSMDDIFIDGEPVHGVAAFGVVLAGGLIALLTTFFALSLTGVILAGVAIGLALLVALILGSIALALAPLLLPLLLLLAVIALFTRRKHA